MQDLKRTIVEKGIKQLLEESGVPLRVHLKVVEELKKRLDAHDNDRAQFQQILLHVGNTTKMHRTVLEEHGKAITHALSLKQGRTGSSGRDGRDGNEGKRGPAGRDGKSVNIQRLVDEILAQIGPAKEGVPGKDADFDKEALFTEFVSLIKKNRLLDATNIKGLQGWVKDGVHYKFEELMHGGGSSSAGTAVDNEIVSGSGTAWTLANTPVSGSVKLYGAGIRLIPGAGNDYTISGKNITTVNSYAAGTLTADYSK